VIELSSRSEKSLWAYQAKELLSRERGRKGRVLIPLW